MGNLNIREEVNSNYNLFVDNVEIFFCGFMFIVFDGNYIIIYEFMD